MAEGRSLPVSSQLMLKLSALAMGVMQSAQWLEDYDAASAGLMQPIVLENVCLRPCGQSRGDGCVLPRRQTGIVCLVYSLQFKRRRRVWQIPVREDSSRWRRVVV